MLRAAGFPYREMEACGVFVPVSQCAVRYLGTAEYDDEIELLTWIADLRRARVEPAWKSPPSRKRTATRSPLVPSNSRASVSTANSKNFPRISSKR
jgi:hypothetical protein